MRFEFVENQNLEMTDEQKSFLHELFAISTDIKQKLGMRNMPIQMIDDNTIRFDGIVANIKYGNVHLIVKPKISQTARMHHTDDELMRILYLRTIKTCKSDLRSVIYYTSMSADDEADNSFIDCASQYFLEKLEYARQRMPIVTYIKHEEKRSTIKGKILLQRELMSPKTDGKTWCKYKVLNENNKYNALLKWCCDYLAKNVETKSIKRRLLVASETFAEQSFVLSKSNVKLMKLPRNFDAYRECFLIAHNMFLYKNQDMSFQKSSRKPCGYVIKMEKAFENMVCFYAGRYASNVGILHRSQADKILAKTPDDKKNLEVHIKPDDLLIDGTRSLIVDAKYKRLEIWEKPEREDFYQMIAHCLAYGTGEAVLIYPGLYDSNYDMKTWVVTQSVNGHDLSIYSGKIDVFSEDSEIVNQIDNIVRETHFGGVT